MYVRPKISFRLYIYFRGRCNTCERGCEYPKTIMIIIQVLPFMKNNNLISYNFPLSNSHLFLRESCMTYKDVGQFNWNRTLAKSCTCEHDVIQTFQNGEVLEYFQEIILSSTWNSRHSRRVKRFKRWQRKTIIVRFWAFVFIEKLD